MGFTLITVSCEPETRPAKATDHLRMLDSNVINYNRQIVRSENIEIEDFIARHRWQMIKSPTGLRYMIYSQGQGNKIKKGEGVELKYTLSLLDGSLIYTSDSGGIKLVYPGTSESETGLQEALLLMHTGDKAKLIIPSHLAFGLLGDLKKIPAGATIVYDIEIPGKPKENR